MQGARFGLLRCLSSHYVTWNPGGLPLEGLNPLEGLQGFHAVVAEDKPQILKPLALKSPISTK